MTSIKQLWLTCCRGAIAIFIPVLAACEPSPAKPIVDRRLCEQTYEFGNYGCTDITGQVLGSAGQPLSGIGVAPRYFPGRYDFNSPALKTDADGRFWLRLHRFGTPPAEGPDTVSLYIRALDFRSPDASVRDSALIQVSVAPVGAVAPLTHVVLRLPTP